MKVSFRPRVEILVVTEFNCFNQPLHTYHVIIPDWKERMVFLEHDYYYSPTLN